MSIISAKIARRTSCDTCTDRTVRSKGKGFQGVMKRWGFKGGPATHGASKFHRKAGSTGQRQDPGKVFKGKKMPGQMGNSRVTVKRLRVMRINVDDQLIMVKGAVPGPKVRLWWTHTHNLLLPNVRPISPSLTHRSELNLVYTKFIRNTLASWWKKN